VTTDLTGDFELGEDEFDWDVFRPDPDDAEIAAEAAALENESDLLLDDSDFDWDTALGEDAESEDAVAQSARAGAAYDRIVDTMRPPPAPIEAEREPEPGAEAAGDDAADAADAAALAVGWSLLTDADAEADAEPIGKHTAGRATEVGHERDDADALFAATAGETESLIEVEAEAEGPVEAEAEAEAEDETDFGQEWDTLLLASGSREAADAATPEEALEPDSEWERESEPETEPLWTTASDDPEEHELELELDLESEPASESARELAEPTAVAASSWAAEEAVATGPEPGPDWSTTPDGDAVQDWEAGPDWDAGPDWEAAEDWDADPLWEPAAAAPFFIGDKDEDPGEQSLEDLFGPPKKRSRVYTATVVLACLFLVVVLGVVGVRALHRNSTSTNTNPPAPAANAGTHGATTSSQSDAARIQSATDAVDSATTAATVGLNSLSAFPTPTNVEAVVNPYISSLQLYQTVLAGTAAPAAAKSAAANAQSELRQDLHFLETINGLPAAQLGSYLQQFDSDATQLQSTLSALEQNLRPSPS
jgi:hypothetical protein